MKMRLSTDEPAAGACVAIEAQQQPSPTTIFAENLNAFSMIFGYLAGYVASAGIRKIAALTSAEVLLALAPRGPLPAFTKPANDAVAHRSMPQHRRPLVILPTISFRYIALWNPPGEVC